MIKKRYPTEFKHTIVSLHQSEKTVHELTKEFELLDYPYRSISNTVKQRIKILEKQLKDVKLERDILKKLEEYFLLKRQEKYQFIKYYRLMFLVEKMCKILKSK